MHIPTSRSATTRSRVLTPSVCNVARRRATHTFRTSLHASPAGGVTESLVTEVVDNAPRVGDAPSSPAQAASSSAAVLADAATASAAVIDAGVVDLPAPAAMEGPADVAALQPPTTTGLVHDLTPLFENKKTPDRPFLPPVDGFIEVVLGTDPQGYTSDCIRNFVGPHDGPVRLITPLIARPPGSPDPSTLPLLFYFPGIDGTGLAAYRQFPTLTEAFDLRCIVYPPGNRTPFAELTTVVADLVAAEVEAVADGRPVYLLGESFGGMLCLSVAASPAGRANVDRVVLVNPATSFARSPWARVGNAVAAMPPQIYSTLPFMLSPILTSPFNIAMRYVDRDGPLPTQLSDFAHGLVGLVPELGNLRAVLPPATLAWRLELLREGCEAMEGRYTEVQQRVLVVAGENDLLIPSSTEAPALTRRLPRARHLILQGRSHALLQEAGVDLVAILKEQGFYVTQTVLSADFPPSSSPVLPATAFSSTTSNGNGSGNGTGTNPTNGTASSSNGTTTTTATATTTTTNGATSSRTTSSSSASSSRRRAAGSGAAFGTPQPVQLPTLKELDKAAEDGGTANLRRLVSPVFFSTDASGRVMQGLDAVPTERPLLFVGNHQLFAPDMPLMVEQFIREKGMLLRGLAHPGTLNGFIADTDGQSDNSPGSRGSGDFMKTFGGVPVSGRNMFLLLQQGEAALLYPGGAREALKHKGEKYQLIWPKRAEFVRMAARFGATIVPFGAVGAEDSLNLVLDQTEVLRLPVVGDWLRQQQAGVRQARTGVSVSEDNVDLFVPPLISFNPPDRFYYLFQRPITTTPEMASDRAACEALYTQVKEEVEGAIGYLLHKRATDPYRAPLPRLLYEASLGGGRQAPTFTP